jgi:hypothetical protein
MKWYLTEVNIGTTSNFHIEVYRGDNNYDHNFWYHFKYLCEISYWKAENRKDWDRYINFGLQFDCNWR